MGAYASVNPPIPPGSRGFSYARQERAGSADASSATSRRRARFGINWLMKMWDDKTKTLYYQVDNTQDWNYYGEGDPASMAGNCGGTFASPDCLITEYDIWTLPQAADNFQQPGDPKAMRSVDHLLHLQPSKRCMSRARRDRRNRAPILRAVW